MINKCVLGGLDTRHRKLTGASGGEISDIPAAGLEILQGEEGGRHHLSRAADAFGVLAHDWASICCPDVVEHARAMARNPL